MVEKIPFGEGASINRPPLFFGLNNQFWKVRMKIFVESLDKRIWDTIENGPFIPKFEKDESSIEKPWSQWIDAENKKAKFDCIAKNIITSALNSDEFFRISQCSSAKEMWEKGDFFGKKNLFVLLYFYLILVVLIILILLLLLCTCTFKFFWFYVFLVM